MKEYNEPKNKTDNEFIADVRDALDERLTQVDDAILLRLSAVRKQAVHSSNKKNTRSGFGLGWAVPVGGFAATALVTVLVIGTWQQSSTDTKMTAVLEDMTLLSAGEELEFYEDLEFYQWLTDEQEAG